LKGRKIFFSISKIVQSLSKEARKEFAEEFSEDLKEFLSKTAVYKAINGKIHLANDTILNVVLTNPGRRSGQCRRPRRRLRMS
jgi:hypothetical protein